MSDIAVENPLTRVLKVPRRNRGQRFARRSIMSIAPFLLLTAIAAPSQAAQPKTAGTPAKAPEWVYPLIPGFGGVHPRPDLPVRPDPSVNYKIFVDVVSHNRDPAGRFEGLQRLARLVNLMAYAKVPPQHVHIVALLDGESAMAAVSNDFYRKNFKGDNPNLALVQALKKAGVELLICGQGLAENGMPDSVVSPDATVTLSALTDMVVYGQRGYIYMQL